MSFFTLFQLLGIPQYEWGMYLQIVRYQVWQMNQFDILTYISSMLWIGIYIGCIHDWIYGVEYEPHYYLERGI